MVYKTQIFVIHLLIARPGEERQNQQYTVNDQAISIYATKVKRLRFRVKCES